MPCQFRELQVFKEVSTSRRFSIAVAILHASHRLNLAHLSRYSNASARRRSRRSGSKSVRIPRSTVRCCRPPSLLRATFASVKASHYPSLPNMPLGVDGREGVGRASQRDSDHIIERGKKTLPLDRPTSTTAGKSTMRAD